MKKRKVISWILLTIIGILLLYIWVGFLFPNPAMEGWDSWGKIRIVLWMARIGLLLLIGLILVVAFTKNKNLAQNLGVLLATLFLIFIVAGFFVHHMGDKSMRLHVKNQYHSFLQIKPPGTDTLNYPFSRSSVKIFCLGGSTTAFKNSQGVSWPEMLGEELRRKYHSDSIFVFNFGIPWYTTLHSLINYQTNLRQHKPDVIIVMHNINDFLHNADFSHLSNGTFRQDYGHFLGPIVDLIKTRHTPFQVSRVIQFRNLWYYDVPKKAVVEQDSFPGLKSFDQNINTIIDLAAADSATVILLTQPNVLSEKMETKVQNACTMITYESVGKDRKWSFGTAYRGMKQYNEKVEKIAEKRGTFLVDLEQVIPKSLVYFTDEVHYTDTTFNIVSQMIADEIERLEILPRGN